MAWHRDSFGILLQRFLFALILMSSVLTFRNCVETASQGEEMKDCVVHTCIPFVFIIFIVTLKVSVISILQTRLVMQYFLIIQAHMISWFGSRC